LPVDLTGIQMISLLYDETVADFDGHTSYVPSDDDHSALRCWLHTDGGDVLVANTSLHAWDTFNSGPPVYDYEFPERFVTSKDGVVHFDCQNPTYATAYGDTGAPISGPMNLTIQGTAATPTPLASSGSTRSSPPPARRHRMELLIDGM
jgi:hypothetical protein